MNNETHDTTADAESDSNPLQATRRTALQGAGLAGLLAMGVGSAGAHQDTPTQTTNQAEQQTTDNTDGVPVTWANFPRAYCHASFQSIVSKGGFGQFYHVGDLSPIGAKSELGIGEQRDSLYSLGVFDLTEPVTITKPDTGDRYQSMNVQNEDQYVKLSVTEPGTYTLTQDQIGTQYAGIVFRTFVDADDPADVKQVRQLQDQIDVVQSSPGSFEIPNWDQQSLKQIDDALRTLYYTIDNWSDAFGDVGQVDPVKFFISSASGWTGVPEPSEAVILQRTPDQNDGDTPYTLTVEDVPVDGFWSISVYNSRLSFVKNKYDAYTVSNVTADRNADGSITIHFGGDPAQKNFLYTPEGWRYLFRFYDPREPIINRNYQFPEAEPIE
ncbi:DUF1214 domain-containing protein [Halomicrococcus sp. SG-WS-1]|uniref:DUF1214 domain-containing protein n=1 Tax=Halomicrococcus sp. SG-WS-1 TaxID=3439057 RepID=UPI003F795766